jgi:hypothetical protein
MEQAAICYVDYHRRRDFDYNPQTGIILDGKAVRPAHSFLGDNCIITYPGRHQRGILCYVSAIMNLEGRHIYVPCSANVNAGEFTGFGIQTSFRQDYFLEIQKALEWPMSVVLNDDNPYLTMEEFLTSDEQVFTPILYLNKPKSSITSVLSAVKNTIQAAYFGEYRTAMYLQGSDINRN